VALHYLTNLIRHLIDAARGTAIRVLLRRFNTQCTALCLGSLLGAWIPVAYGLDHTQLAVIINTLDPLSVQIGEYYASQRSIVFQNIIKVEFAPGKTVLTRQEFDEIKARVDENSLPHIQAYALTWAAPYRVECMSITAAFAFGFDPAFCASGCKPTQPSRYFNSRSTHPFTQLKMRPTMSIAAATFDHAKALIDRGVKADGSFPPGTAYLLSTSDAARNVRSASYPVTEELIRGHIFGRTMKQDAVKYATDVLFYFTGLAQVAGLDTLRFVPGAIADHLTSFGGSLTDSGQMSALRWLEAGATGSYGTVVEPCNMPQKFPSPPLVIGHYLRGETLIEAYWKSVLMPGQGIFIGEPLATPFRRADAP
jgi:uncharacterized protein (TIGR03790 family)